MKDYDRDDLVVDVADALTLHHEVQWDRCERLATPANRWVLENLRAFSGVLAGGRSGTGDAWPGWAGSRSAPFAGPLVRAVVYALITFAALQTAASVGLIGWGWDTLYRENGDLHVFASILLVGPSLAACLLLFGGRRERRTWLLGVYFLLAFHPPSRSATPTSASPTCTRSCSRPRSCGRSPESVPGCIAGAGSTISRAGWSG